MQNDILTQKKIIRSKIREQRYALKEGIRENLNTDLTKNLIKICKKHNVKSISCYINTLNEPATNKFILWAINENIKIIVPLSREDGLLDWAVVDSEMNTSIGKYGIPEPDSQILSPIVINEVDLMLIPACAVSKDGVRLGWGRGYFDKTIGSMESKPPIYAIVFPEEIYETLPANAWDQKINGIVSASGIIEID